MFKRLRVRLTIVCALSTGLVLAGMALASLHYSSRQLGEQYEQAFASDLNTVFFYLRGQNAIDHKWLSQTEAASGLWISIESKGKPMLFNSQNPLRETLTGLAAETALRDYAFDYGLPPSGTLQPDVAVFTMETGGNRYRAAVASVPVSGNDNWLSVIILKGTAGEEAQLLSLRLTFATCVVLALLCLAAFAWFFSAWAVRPVEESRKRQSEFVSAASHELRSPLAVMQATAGAMKNAPPEKILRFAETIEGECTRLARLTSDLLRLAGADSHSWAITLAPTEPETILLSAGERFEELAAVKNISLSVELPNQPLPRLRCDGQRIEQVLSILLDNAICYTPEGSCIQISACHKRKAVHFVVADNGPGIPDSQKPKVFSRFYRADSARADREHYGLGLSVAKEIAALHKGNISVADASAGGTVFTLSIPIH